MMVAMTEQAGRPGQSIYQVGTSTRNPVRYRRLKEFGLQYFKANPWVNKKGKPVKVGKVKVLKSMDSFHRYMAFRYLLWLKVCCAPPFLFFFLSFFMLRIHEK